MILLLKKMWALSFPCLILGRVLLYLGMVGRFCSGDPRFWDFWSDWVPILYLITEKNGLSLSHLVPKILGPKFGVIFKYFVSIFSLIFNPIDPLFYWSEIFLTPHFYKALDLIGSIFLLLAEHSYQKIAEVPTSSLLPGMTFVTGPLNKWTNSSWVAVAVNISTQMSWFKMANFLFPSWSSGRYIQIYTCHQKALKGKFTLKAPGNYRKVMQARELWVLHKLIFMIYLISIEYIHAMFTFICNISEPANEWHQFQWMPKIPHHQQSCLWLAKTCKGCQSMQRLDE